MDHSMFALPRGAGHDGRALSALCPVGMLFVRRKGGVSRGPAESVTPENADAPLPSGNRRALAHAPVRDLRQILLPAAVAGRTGHLPTATFPAAIRFPESRFAAADSTMTHHHEGHAHTHSHGAGGNERRVFRALLLTGGFLLVETAGAVVSGSLALLADAGHMLTDTAALGLSWYAFRTVRLKPARPRHSYGHHRFEVLAAFVNGSVLIGIAAWIAIEAVRRLFEPVHILGETMMTVAVLGLGANLASFLILHGGDRENLNIRGAALHVLGDLLGSVGAIVAAGVILWTGWTPIDPILSVLVAVLVLRSAWLLASRSWHVLMEGAPEHLDVEEVKRELVGSVPSVLDVHHVHLWSLTPERPLVTLHARVAERADHEAVLHGLQRVLRERFDLHHATIQIEAGLCTDAVSPEKTRAGSAHREPDPSLRDA